jgi:hypothetical protein
MAYLLRPYSVMGSNDELGVAELGVKKLANLLPMPRVDRHHNIVEYGERKRFLEDMTCQR